MLTSDRYFLGANSVNGFYSLYDSFLPKDERNYTYYIKAGPGGGKSTFLRKIGKEAEALGMDVEYVLCSGDPASLDGIYIPRLHRAYVDATAPHVQEPLLPGITGEYLSLGFYHDRNRMQKDSSAFRQMQELYKAKYRMAYKELEKLRIPLSTFPRELTEDIEARAAQLCRCMLNPRTEPTAGRRRFLTAFTPKGHVLAENPLYKCRTVLHIDREDSAAGSFLHDVFNWGCSHGCPCIEFLSPLFPEKPEMVLFPEELTAVYSVPADNHIPVIGWPLPCLEDLPTEDVPAPENTLREAKAYLGEAKAYHDTLEDMYRPYIDFSRQEELLQEHITALQREC